MMSVVFIGKGMAFEKPYFSNDYRYNFLENIKWKPI